MADYTIKKLDIQTIEKLRAHLEQNRKGVIDIAGNDQVQIRYDLDENSTEVQFKKPSSSNFPFLKEIASESLLGGVGKEVANIINDISSKIKLKNTG